VSFFMKMETICKSATRRGDFAEAVANSPTQRRTR